MTHDNTRKSIRLKNYDYSKNGLYFVTICAHNRECYFGNIDNCKMILNNSGKMVQIVWNEIPKYYNGIKIDAFQIMPNHIHGIIEIDNTVGATPRGCFFANGQAQGPAPTGGLSLPDVVHRFKTMTTKRYINGVNKIIGNRFINDFGSEIIMKTLSVMINHIIIFVNI